MIARVWRGATRAEDAEAYLRYLKETGFRAYDATPGNRGVLGLVRVDGDRAEFLLVSLWETEESIRRFAGDDVGRAVFYPEDERYLIEADRTVDHYAMTFEEPGGAPAASPGTVQRVWHGWTAPENADRYERLLRETIFPGIAARGPDGYRGIRLLRRDAGDEVEFVTLMSFDSLADVREFAGDDHEKAYVPPPAREVLSRFDDRSAHYEVAESRSRQDT